MTFIKLKNPAQRRKPTYSMAWSCCLMLALMSTRGCLGFWDAGTTTPETDRSEDRGHRQSFFRWQRVEFDYFHTWYTWEGQQDQKYRRALCWVAGVSIDDLPIGTAIILNKRTLITSANLLDPYATRQKDLRVWALGRAGRHTTPYRYRVWRFRRLLPRSLNPEHWHGAKGLHSPRHDVAIIHTWDQLYLYWRYPKRYMYASRASIKANTRHRIIWPLYFVGSGFEYLQHIQQNYKIFYALLIQENIVNCEKYLPKWWGKFICIINDKNLAGLPNGGGFFSDWDLSGLGCFEIRYNEDRIFVFTDLRYYFHWIVTIANYTPFEYYEYAYPQWGVQLGSIYDGHDNNPTPPLLQGTGDKTFWYW